GVALLHAPTPYQCNRPEYAGDYSMMKRAYALMPTVARTAMGKVMLRSGHGTLPPQARNVARSFASSPRELRADRIELLQLPAIFNEAKALHTLNGKPLAVVSASIGEMRGWTAAQNKLAQLSANSTSAPSLAQRTRRRSKESRSPATRARRSPTSWRWHGQQTADRAGSVTGDQKSCTVTGAFTSAVANAFGAMGPATLTRRLRGIGLERPACPSPT